MIAWRVWRRCSECGQIKPLPPGEFETSVTGWRCKVCRTSFVRLLWEAVTS